MSNTREHGAARGEPVIPAGEAPCIWMQAGFIAYKLCDRDFRCETCPLDASLRPGTWSGKEAPADEAEVVEDRDAGAAAALALPAAGDDGRAAPSGWLASLVEMHVADPPADRLYQVGHAWIRCEADASVRVGIDDFAAAISGVVRGVAGPRRGTVLRCGRPCAWIEESGGVSTLWAPVSGILLEVNPALAQDPTLVVTDPYDSGWILRLQPLDFDAEGKRLEDAGRFAVRLRRDAAAWTRQVWKELRSLAPQLGPTLQDGGEHVIGLDGLLGARRRHALASRFFDAGRRAH